MDTEHRAPAPDGLPRPFLDALDAVADRLDAAGVVWLVTGSGARALRGFATEPRDLDLEVAGADAAAAAAALGMAPDTTQDARGRSIRAVGAVAGMEVDLTAGLTLTGPGGVLPADFPLMAQFATHVRVGRRTVRVAPLEEQIVRILVTGDEARRRRFVEEAPDGFIALNDYVELRLGSARAAR